MNCRWCRKDRPLIDNLCIICTMKKERHKHPLLYQLFLKSIEEYNVNRSEAYQRKATYGRWKKFCIEGTI